MSATIAQLLLPATAIEPRRLLLPLDALPPDEALPGDPPARDFVESIRRVKRVLQPIVLFEHGDGQIEVVCGRRRIKGARAAGLASIPADVYPAGWVSAGMLAVIENAQRSANPVSDYEAIARLLEQGADEGQICAATGLTRDELRARYRLHALLPALWTALKAGTIRAAIALDAARLPAKAQETLVARLAETGKLTAADVRVARQAPRTAVVESLPATLFATPDAATAPTWQDGVGRLLLQALALVPTEQAALRANLTSALSCLRSVD